MLFVGGPAGLLARRQTDLYPVTSCHFCWGPAEQVTFAIGMPSKFMLAGGMKEMAGFSRVSGGYLALLMA